MVAKGTVRIDKDFGAGYAYPVIVEDAKLTQVAAHRPGLPAGAGLRAGARAVPGRADHLGSGPRYRCAA